MFRLAVTLDENKNSGAYPFNDARASSSALSLFEI